MIPVAGTGTHDLLHTRVHYVERGRGSLPVVLVHAIGFDHRSWDLLIPHLEERCRIVALDLPGHGQSDKPARAEYSLPALGARVVRLLDELGWEEAVLIGNSLGGGTSLAAALQAPGRIRGLALLNSVAFRGALPLLGRLAFVPVLPHFSGYAPGLLVRLGLETVRSGWGSVTSERCTACGSYLRSREGRDAFFGTLRRLYGPDLDQMAGHYREIPCPALVLHGERDPLIRLPHAERLAREIPAGEFVRLPRCGHFPQEECVDKVAAALLPFLDRVSSSPRRHGDTESILLER